MYFYFTVVSLPYYSYIIKINYQADAPCDDALLETLELYLPQLIQKDICEINNEIDLCYVRIKDAVCDNNTHEVCFVLYYFISSQM